MRTITHLMKRCELPLGCVLLATSLLIHCQIRSALIEKDHEAALSLPEKHLQSPSEPSKPQGSGPSSPRTSQGS